MFSLFPGYEGSNPLLLFAILVSFIAFVSGLLNGFRFEGRAAGYALAMLCLAAIQLTGLFFVGDFFAIRYVFFVIAIAVFACCFVSGSLKPNANFVVGLGVAAISARFIFYLFDDSSLDLKNTLSGILVFVIAYMVYCHTRDCDEQGVGFFRPRIRAGALLVSVVLAIVMIDIAKSRTALIVFLIIALTFMLLIKAKPSPKTLKIAFFVFIGLLFAALFIYANAKSFGWYDFLNGYSVRIFGKNIDSSRSALWMQALDSLSSNYVFGLGTGVQPEGSFAGKSFHNSFLQLLVENGIVGLLVFLAALYFLWAQISESPYPKSRAAAIAIFSGIIIYNCFESTLLCNKLSLGFIEWLLIASASCAPRERKG